MHTPLPPSLQPESRLSQSVKAGNATWDRMDPAAWPGAYHLTFTARVAPGSPVPKVLMQPLQSVLAEGQLLVVL